MLSSLFIKVLEMLKAFFLSLYSEGTCDVYDVTERRTDCDNLHYIWASLLYTNNDKTNIFTNILIPKVGTELHNNN